MKKRFVLCTTIVLICITSYSYLLAQETTVRFQQAGNLKDYSFKQTRCLFQDSRGLIWIGTLRGMDRWDGKQIKSYAYNPFDSLGLPAKTVWSITEDKQNTLWLADRGGGLNKFELKSEKFSHINLPMDSSESGTKYIKYDPRGFLWLGGRHGIYQYYPDRDSLIQILVSDPDLDEKYHSINLIEYDSTDVIWMADLIHGLCFMDPGSSVFKPQIFKVEELPDGRLYCSDVCMDRDGILWILGDRSELIRFNPYTKTIDFVCPRSLESPPVNTLGGIVADSQGKIWFGMVHVLNRYDPITGSREIFDFPEPRAVIRDLVEDIQGNILIATLDGVQTLDKKASKIRTYSEFSDTIIKEAQWISEVIRDNQNLWIGTFGSGVIRYNRQTGNSVWYQKGDQSGGLAGNYIVRILKDRNNKIWAMEEWGALHLYNPEIDRFEPVPVSSSRYITEDKKGFFWLVRRERLLRFDPVTFDTVSIHFIEPLPVLEANLDYTPFIKDDTGNFWLGTMQGLFKINPVTGEWILFVHHRNNPNSLPDTDVRSIFCDSRNRIWISTPQGLSRIISDSDSSNISFNNYILSTRNLKRTTRITEDGSGNIWIGTFDGIQVIKADGSIIGIDHRDGLPEGSKMIWALNSDSAGHIYAGHLNLVEIPPDFLVPNEIIPPVLLTEFRVSGELLAPGEESPLKQSILFTDWIDLKHKQNFFRLDFAALNYTDPHRNRYRYLMVGVDQDTVEAKERSYAEYTDLSPGKYRFWVTGSNNTGLWNPDGVSINIRIHPPWHRSNAALAIYFLIVIALIYGFLRFRMARIREEKLKLEKEVAIRIAEVHQKNEQIIEMERLKTNFFTDISHEFRTPLSLISGPLEKLIKQESMSQKQSEWLAMIKRNSQRLFQLVNQLLDIARLDSGHMKLVLENSDILKKLRVLVHGYHSLAEKNHIRYILDIPERELVAWNDWDKINKIVTNLLSNAFKFTPDFGTVKFRVKTEHGSVDKGSANIRLIVADTGPGIPTGEHEKIFERFYRADYHYEEASGTGIGLAVTRELVELMHGESIVKSIEGKGSVFIVTIPLGKEHLSEKEYVLKEDLKHIPGKNNGKNFVEETISSEEITQQDIDILIVEDNQEVRSFIKENLEVSYRVLEAEDGLRGLELAISKIPDLIITDIMMPGMDGNELCRKLKNDERTSHIPVIMLTARASSKDKIKGLGSGADDYIYKPFVVDEIKVRILNLLDQRERLRKKYEGYIGIDWSKITITTLDEQFLKKVTGFIAEHLHDLNFDVSALQEKMAMSHSNLYRKVKGLTGESPTYLIRIMRLKLAASLMKNGEKNITTIMMNVGFSNPSYFAKCFKEYFGSTPKAYQKSIHKPEQT